MVIIGSFVPGYVNLIRSSNYLEGDVGTWFFYLGGIFKGVVT